MSDKMLIPSIEKRLGAFSELFQRNDAEQKSKKSDPAITISREFGCAAFPMAECLQKMMEKRTGKPWTIMDKALLEEVAKNHDLSEKTLRSLGEDHGFVDEIISTFEPAWKTDKDHYRLLCRQIYSLAKRGNVILLGRGSANITQSLKNCYHFKLFASMKLRTCLIAERMKLSHEEAEKLINKKQHQREVFMKEFLNQDARDLRYYHLIFNTDKNPSEKIAHTIMEYVLTKPSA